MDMQTMSMQLVVSADEQTTRTKVTRHIMQVINAFCVNAGSILQEQHQLLCEPSICRNCHRCAAYLSNQFVCYRSCAIDHVLQGNFTQVY
jgi:hypothetical protein